MYRRMFAAFVAALALVAAPMWIARAAEADTADKPLKVGDKAPDFNLPKSTDEKAPKKLSEYQGKQNVLLAFYPKAFTGGCTTQLCGYRDEFDVFKSGNTDIVAISADEQDYSDKFKSEYNYPFTVLGDIEASVIKKYGVGREGKTGGLMANRSVFLVDKAGVIRYIDLEYNIAQDKEPLYAAIKKLESGTEQKDAQTKSADTPAKP